MRLLMYLVRNRTLLSLIVAMVCGGSIVFFIPKSAQSTTLISVISTLIGVVIAIIFQRTSRKERDKIESKVRFNAIYSKFSSLKAAEQRIHLHYALKESGLDMPDEFIDEYLKIAEIKDSDYVIKNLILTHHDVGLAKELINDAKDKSSDELKTLTVTQLFLLFKKRELFKSKIMTVASFLAGAAGLGLSLTSSFYVLILPFVMLILLTAYDLILTFRIESGYFGANKFEALQLLQYIEKNKDDVGGDSPGGLSRKVFNDLKTSNTLLPVSGGQEVIS